jgi:hypothetical protein
MTRHELADAMLKGKNTPGVMESRAYYVTTGIGALCRVCGLGAALVGKLNGDFYKAESEFEAAGGFYVDSDEPTIFADLLEIPRSLAVAVEIKHLNGLSIEDIAKWLKASEGQGHD